MLGWNPLQKQKLAHFNIYVHNERKWTVLIAIYICSCMIAAVRMPSILQFLFLSQLVPEELQR